MGNPGKMLLGLFDHINESFPTMMTSFATHGHLPKQVLIIMRSFCARHNYGQVPISPLLDGSFTFYDRIVAVVKKGASWIA